MADKTYTVTYPETGREWTLRTLPPHFLLMFGQLPTNLTEKAVAAISEQNEKAVMEEITKTLTQQQIFDSAIFAREAVKYACVKPQIVLVVSDPETEISAFDVTEEEFNFLVKTALTGGGSQSAAKFRGESRQPPLARSARKKR